MKKIILSAAIAAMTLVGGAASAQGYGGYGRYDNRHDGGRHDAYRGHGGWRQGQVYPHYRQRDYYISDYRAYRLPPPRAGYRYYRSDNGDVVMAAIASGIIGAIVADQFHDNDRRDHRYYGR